MPRSNPSIMGAWRIARDMQAAGFELFPCTERNTPRDKGFLYLDYRKFDFLAHIGAGGNVGVRCRPSDLIIDVDVKEGKEGADSFEKLCLACGADLDAHVPTTITGSGGRHFYYRIPDTFRPKWHPAGYQHIDFQSLGRYVVIPGSVHPKTGAEYKHIGAPWTAVPDAPKALLDILRKPPRVVRSNQGGNLTLEQFQEALTFLHAPNFGSTGAYGGEWLDIAMAGHDATNGDGLQQWLDWCATDPEYGDDAREVNERRWDSFSVGGAITWKTLLRAVSRSGEEGAGFVAGLGHDPAADFDDEYSIDADGMDTTDLDNAPDDDSLDYLPDPPAFEALD